MVNHVKHCILCTAFHTNDTDFIQQVGVVNKYFCYTELSVSNGLCLCSTGLNREYCVGTGTEEYIWSEDKSISRRMNKIALWGAAWLVLFIKYWWVVNWKKIGQMGEEKCTGEIKNTHKNFSWNPWKKEANIYF